MIRKVTNQLNNRLYNRTTVTGGRRPAGSPVQVQKLEPRSGPGGENLQRDKLKTEADQEDI